MFWWRRYWLYLAVGTSGVLVGGVIGRLLPPFILDDPFWRSFWVSPAVGGFAAVIAAVIAFSAAKAAAHASRIGAERQEWWHRAEWALNLAVSGEGRNRDVGMQALRALAARATDLESEIIVAVTNTYLDEESVDEPAQTTDN